MTKPTQWHVRPAKTQISLGIRPVWAESSLCAQWVAKDLSFLHAYSEDSDQTGMPRLICVFAGRTCHFVGFVMRRLKHFENMHLINPLITLLFGFEIKFQISRYEKQSSILVCIARIFVKHHTCLKFLTTAILSLGCPGFQENSFSNKLIKNG